MANEDWGKLEVIYDPRKSVEVAINIVAVHGLAGHKHGSWTLERSEQDQCMWLKDLLPRRLPNARIMVFNYQCEASLDGTFLSTNGLHESGRALLKELTSQIEIKDNKTPVVFLGHDLGGILVKKALLLASAGDEHSWIARHTALLICFGTPHRAEDPVAWDDVMFHITSEAGCSSDIMPSQLRALSQRTKEVSMEFDLVKNGYRMINMYKSTMDTARNGRDTIIDHYSFTTDFLYDTNMERETSHQNLCSFAHDKDDIFTLIVSAIRAETNEHYRESLLTVSDRFPLLITSRGARTENATWFKQHHKAYTAWLADPASPTIFIEKGYCPSDDSTVSGALYWNLRQRARCVAYYPFHNSEGDYAEMKWFMVSIISQIITQDPTQTGRIQDMFLSISQQRAWTYRPLFSLLHALLSSSGMETMFLVLDDIQNCNSATAKLLSSLVDRNDDSSSQAAVKIILLGRKGPDNPDIEKLLRNRPSDRIEGQPLFKVNAQRILTRNLPNLLQEKAYLHRFRHDIEHGLQKSSDSWQLSLTFHAVANFRPDIIPSINSITPMLSKIPVNTLNAVYTAFADFPAWAKNALGWILCAQRPLLINELAVAITFFGPDGMRTAQTFDDRALPVDLTTAVKIHFGPFVIVEEGRVFLSHGQAKDCLTAVIEQKNDQSIYLNDIPGDWEITIALLKYLSLRKVMEHRLAACSLGMSKHGIYGLIDYATHSWPAHYKTAASKSSHVEDFLGYIQSLPPGQIWSEVTSRLGTSSVNVDQIDPLLLAAHHGFDALAIKAKETASPELLHSALYLASSEGYTELVRMLVELGIDARNPEFLHALKYACIRGHDEIFDILLNQLDDASSFSDSEVLCRVAELGYQDRVELLLSNGAIADVTHDGTTPLQFATKNGHGSIVKLLLSNAADINTEVAQDPLKPLLYAAKNGHTDIVKCLLEHQPPADITATDDHSRTSLHLAAQQEYNPILFMLLDRAAIGPESEKNGVLNSVDKMGHTALMLASKSGHLENVRLLLRHGAQIDVQDETGHTALYHAIFNQHESIAKDLLNDAPQNTFFKDMNVVFHEAAKLGFDKFMELCLDSHTNGDVDLIKYSDNDGRTALHHAAANGHSTVVSFLLNRGVDVNQSVENTSGSSSATPLVLAALGGRLEVVSLLEKQSADINNRERRRPNHRLPNI